MSDNDLATKAELPRGKRVVVVEDEGITQLQFRMVLEDAGLIVTGTAMNADEAIPLILRERPEIILMDIDIPGSIDGLSITEQVLSEFPTCVVMLTAYSEHRERSEAIGASGYLMKPIDESTLLPEIQASFRKFMLLRSTSA